MTDKKLTDSEIIKALECCCEIAGKCRCRECPLHQRDGSCTTLLVRYVLDLINRLQVENENYSKNNQQMTSDILKLYKELEQAKAENERLKDYNENLQAANTSLSNEILDVKAEAYKECIEKVKGIMQKYCGEITEEDTDNLLKELVGENG